MASRPTARYARAVKQIRAPIDHVWITDSVLSSAFDRYCHVSRPSRRLSSSTPGPLENRRRLGKRRMTGLYSNEFQSTLPPWMIEFPVDLTQWTWKPPTCSDARKEEMEAESRRLSRRLLSKAQKYWLSMDATEGIGMDASNATESIESDESTAVELAGGFSRQLSGVLNVFDRSSGQLDAKFLEVTGALQRDISVGAIEADKVPDILVSFLRSLEQRRQLSENEHKQDLIAEATKLFWSAVIKGLSTSRVQGFEQIESAGINTILVELSKMPPHPHNLWTFRLIMRGVSETSTAQVADGMEVLLRSWFQDIPEDFSHAVSSIASSLSFIDPVKEEHLQILRRLDGSVAAVNLEQPAASAVGRSKWWLTLLARLPHVKDEYLLDAIHRFDYLGGEWTPIKGRETCELLIRQWQSEGLLRSKTLVSSPWSLAIKRVPKASLAALLWHIGEAKTDRSLNRNYFRAIQRLNLTKEFVASFHSWSAARESVSALSIFALKTIRSQDSAVAVKLCELMARHGNGFQRVQAVDWTCSSWKNLVEDLIFDQKVSPVVVWNLFHALPTADEGEHRSKVELIKGMATWFSQTHHLSDRDVLRHVSRCNAWLRAEGETPGEQANLALVRAGVRALKRGEWGRPDVLNWILKVIRKDLGEEQAQKLAKVLLAWRKRNMGRFSPPFRRDQPM